MSRAPIDVGLSGPDLSKDVARCTLEAAPLVDLDAVWGAVPWAVEQDGPLSPRRRVTLVDSGPRAVTADPLPVSHVLDGIQMSRVLTRRSFRPITIAYTAAGAADPHTGRGLKIVEHLSWFVSWLDEEHVRSLPGGMQEFVLLDEQDPAEIDVASKAAIGAQRAQAEARLAARLEVPDGHALVVDGSIGHLAPRETGATLGLVKSCSAQWLQDEESEVPTRAGHRSGTFLIHGRRRGDYSRFSCYLRLHSVTPSSPWALGLVRLEAHDPALLDGLAQFVLDQRQGPGTGDPRWRRHAACVRHVEQMLRNRAPYAFDLR